MNGSRNGVGNWLDRRRWDVCVLDARLLDRWFYPCANQIGELVKIGGAGSGQD
jgi:hypothetical protein